jgi:hypothetical protein
MIVIDLRGQDRACGAIPGTKNIPAMDLLKEIGKYVKDFEEKQIVAFFCQYSAHRAPTAAGCMCSNTLSYYIIYNIYIYYIIYILYYIYIMCFLLLSDFKSLPQPLKSNTFRRGKPKQQGRQLLSKELPVQAAGDDPGGRVQGMGGS